MAEVVHVYWREGCGFCWTLRRALKQAGVKVEEHDIWSDPAAAAFVREHNRGNETVPTVQVGETVLTNPRSEVLLALLRTEHPATLAS